MADNSNDSLWEELLGAAVAAEEATDPFRKGSVLLDTYRIESDPLYGGMARVYRVHHIGWNADLAMKRLLPNKASDETRRREFLDACRDMIQLGDHPNIVRCFHTLEINGEPCAFSEWMDNGTLRDAIQSKALYAGTEREVTARILDIAIQYARGLYYGHKAGLIHTDVKPANLLLTKDGQAKVSDFSLCGMGCIRRQAEAVNPDGLDEGEPVWSAGGYTPAYCSMEQMEGKDLTRRTDIYSWALTAAEMYIGRRVWLNGVAGGASWNDYLKEEEFSAPLPEGMAGLLEKCLQLSACDRPGHFGIVEEELKAIYRNAVGQEYPRPEPETAKQPKDPVQDERATIPDDPWAQLLGAAREEASRQAEEPAAGTVGPYQKGSVLLDTYRIESNLIPGGMGSVWRVRHTGWGVDLAMKRPKPEYFTTEENKKRFVDECQCWIDLGLHPNIVSCYYVREIDGVPTIFSEWMENGDLEHHIQSGTLYGGTEQELQARLLDIAIQYARGLHYAHESGLIHQDVKPANLLLTNDWQAKAADFGLANARAQLTVLEGSPTQLDAGQSLNAAAGGYTPAYCSMEQMDHKVLTRRTDIYSWAVSVMEMYIGSRPWQNGVVAGAGCRDYMAMDGCRVKMPPALQELLAKCMEIRADDRPHDFAAVEAELQAIWLSVTGEAYPRPEPETAADTADSLNNRALSYLDMGQTEEAERLWEEALKKEAGHENTLFNRTLSRWRRGLTDMQWPETLLKAVRSDEVREAMAETLNKESKGVLTLPGEALPLPESVLSMRWSARKYTRGARRVYGKLGEKPTNYLVYGVPEGRILFSMEYGGDRLFDAEIHMSQDGEYAAVDIYREGKGRTEVYRLSTGEMVRAFRDKRGKLSPDGTYIAFMDRKSEASGLPSRVTVLETATGEQQCVMTGCQFWDYTWDGRMLMYNEKTQEIFLHCGPGASVECHDAVLFQRHYFYPLYMKQLAEGLLAVQLWDTSFASEKEGYMLCDLNSGTAHQFRGEAELEIQDIALTGDGQYAVHFDSESYAQIWEIKPPRLLGFCGFDRADYGRRLYMEAHPDSVVYSPGPRAEYRLNVIASTGQRLDAQAAFAAKLKEALSAVNAGEQAEALALADEALEMPGYESSPEALRLRALAGKGLKKRGIRRIVPVSVSAPDVLPSRRRQAGQAEARRYAARLSALAQEIRGRWDDSFGEWQFSVCPEEYSRDGRFLLARIHIRQDYDNPAQNCIEITQWIGGAVLNAETGEIVYRNDYFYCWDNVSSDSRDERYCAVKLDHTGSRLLVCGDSDRVQLIPLRDSNELQSFRTSGLCIFCDFLDDDRFVLYQGSDGMVRLFDTAGGAEAQYFFPPEEYGKAGLIDDDCFAIRHGEERTLCFIQWDYELPGKN